MTSYSWVELGARSQGGGGGADDQGMPSKRRVVKKVAGPPVQVLGVEQHSLAQPANRSLTSRWNIQTVQLGPTAPMKTGIEV